jgi:FAD dependent oxidoreductase
MKKISLFFLMALLVLYGCKDSSNHFSRNWDICIYGGTSAGVIAAYSAKILGMSVILVEPGRHLGGLTAGGLGYTDIGNKHAITGLSREFYRKAGRYYNTHEAWTFEPHVAEKIFNDIIDEAEIPVLYEHRIISAESEDGWIRSVELEITGKKDEGSSRTIHARYFMDCSYEGDLMARAGVSYTVGREDNNLYSETFNGVQLRDKHQFPDDIDPYKIPGDPSSGLLWGISPDKLLPDGTGDKKIQAYNFRLCMTQDTANFIPVTKPDNYDPTMYELLGRVIQQREKSGTKQDLGNYLKIDMMPGGKTDINNNGPQSTDLIGMNYDYPEADYETREKIVKSHENYIKGLLYFLGHDQGVPEYLRNEMLSWGWTRDEFADNGGFPHQMYVREARRMIGEYVMTQHNCTGDSTVDDGIGLAAYTMDSHNCQRIVVNGMVKNEGDVQVGGFPPYEISYRALVPKREECKNLTVPVCLSSTHIAFGSIRMEPVFMVLGEAAAVASFYALADKVPVQDIDIKTLQDKLKNEIMLSLMQSKGIFLTDIQSETIN